MCDLARKSHKCLGINAENPRFGPSFWPSCALVEVRFASTAFAEPFCVGFCNSFSEPFEWLETRCFLNATLLLGEESFYSVMSMAQSQITKSWGSRW